MKHRLAILSAVLAAALSFTLFAGCASSRPEPASEPEPEPAAEPASEPMPEWEPEPAAEAYYNYNDFAFDPAYDVGGEQYEALSETGFTLTAAAPLSTFSADVDTASYANVRRLIMDGCDKSQIPAGAVRPEEFVNYFSYDLRRPTGDHKFGITSYLDVCPWNENHELLMLGLTTEALDSTELPRQNITLLVDVSGSMSEDLDMVTQALEKLVDQFREEDAISLVTYANGVDVKLDSATGAEKNKIKRVLRSLSAGGGTAGGAGIQKAYALAERNYIPDGNNRVILVTDGDLNIGISEPDELEALIREKAQSGVYLSVVGTGYGNYRDDNMERLADCGNGNYSYIDSLREANKVFVEEFSSTILTVAADVKFQIEFNPNYVNSYRLIGYEDRRLADTDFRDDTKDAGELGAGHAVVALYELIPCGSADAIDLKYQNAAQSAYAGELATLKLRYKDAVGEPSQELTAVIPTAKNGAGNPDFRFAALVTEFAMVLSDSPNRGTATLEDIQAQCDASDWSDPYRQEFAGLVRMLNGYTGTDWID